MERERDGETERQRQRHRQTPPPNHLSLNERNKQEETQRKQHRFKITTEECRRAEINSKKHGRDYNKTRRHSK